MNTVIICARNSSTRLPGKATVQVCGKPALQHLIERYRQCRRVDKIIVATPFREKEISTLCEMLDVPHFEGDEDDVVARMDDALQCYAPETEYVFRGLGDMLLFEPELIDWRFFLLKARQADVVWCGYEGDPMPAYGCRESPWSRSAWDEIVAKSTGGMRESTQGYISTAECTSSGWFIRSCCRRSTIFLVASS
jgi:GTP:adenosylcobinamide-phosphate guanylyltransferase